MNELEFQMKIIYENQFIKKKCGKRNYSGILYILRELGVFFLRVLYEEFIQMRAV